MLQAIRDSAQGWIAWVIVFLISIPFALWGIQEYLGVGGEPVVVKVGDHEIKKREFDSQFNSYRARLQQSLGKAYQPGLFDDKMLKQNVLNSMVNEALLNQAARRLNLQASDEMIRQEIANVREFQVKGNFDYQLYQTVLKNNGLTADRFSQRIRSSLEVDQLTNAIKNTDFLTQREQQELQRLQNQQRQLAYLTLPLKSFESKDTIAAEKIESYYKTHQSRFMQAERVKLEYVELSPATLGKQIKHSDEDLQAYLEKHRDRFLLPEEFKARHILVMAKKGKEDDAKRKAQVLLEKLKAGEDFAAIAKAESDDKISAQKGGDLGFFGKGIMDPAFEKATMALKPGEISGLVRSAFGYHIIKLDEKRGGGKAKLDQVKDRVRKAYVNELVQKDLYELSERMANLAYETPDSLDPIVEELQLKKQTSGWISRNGKIPDALSSAKVISAAFSEDVLESGNNSEALELGKDRMMVLRVVEHEVAKPKPLQQVKAEIEKQIRAKQAREKARQAGEKLIAETKPSAKLVAPQQIKNAKLIAEQWLNRTSNKAPKAILNKVFAMPKPDKGSSSLAGIQLASGDYVVVQLLAVKEGKADKKQAMNTDRISAQWGNKSFDLYVDALKESIGVEFKQQK